MYESNSCGYGRSSGGCSRNMSAIYGSQPQTMYSAGPSNSTYFGQNYGSSTGKATSHADYAQPSMLETALETVKPMKTAHNYMSGKDRLQLYLNNKKEMTTEAFLSPKRPETPIIQNTTEIMPYIREAFEKLTGEQFPENHLKIHVLDDADFEKAHGPGGRHGPGIQGFALNRQGKGINQVFVRKNHLDRMLLTIGHEIGHVMSPTLPDDRDEEAKAFAFSVAWMKTIRKHNIAGIGNAVMPDPARNGLHDVAYEYLLELIQKGKSALKLFKELANREVSITKRLEVIHL